MQYHTLNEHTFLQTCTEEDRVFKKHSVNIFFSILTYAKKKKNLEAKKKAKKIFEKKQHWSDIFFTKKIKQKRMLYIHIYFRVCTRACERANKW